MLKTCDPLVYDQHKFKTKFQISNADLVILVGADALMPNRHQGISYRNA